MGAHLDLDDRVSGHPLAELELAALRTAAESAAQLLSAAMDRAADDRERAMWGEAIRAVEAALGAAPLPLDGQAGAGQGAGPLEPRAWVVVGPAGLHHLGLHCGVEEAWRDALGYPSPEEIADHQAAGWYAAPAQVFWRRPPRQRVAA